MSRPDAPSIRACASCHGADHQAALAALGLIGYVALADDLLCSCHDHPVDALGESGTIEVSEDGQWQFVQGAQRAGCQVGSRDSSATACLSRARRSRT